MPTNWRKIIEAALEAKTNNGEKIALAILHEGLMQLIESTAFTRDAIDIALKDAYEAGLLPPRRTPLPVTMNLAYTMVWGDLGYFMLASRFLIFTQRPKKKPEESFPTAPVVWL